MSLRSTREIFSDELPERFLVFHVDSEMISYITMFQMMFEGLFQNNNREKPFEDGRESGRAETDVEMAPGLIRRVYSANTQRHTISSVFVVCCPYHLGSFFVRCT